jgi:uncharacterized membrane protein YphA (DoxX/SURF4 family)
MSDNVNRGASPVAAIALLVARILLAIIFLQEGFGKLTRLLEGFSGYLMGHGVLAPYSYPLAIIAAVVEFCDRIWSRGSPGH